MKHGGDLAAADAEFGRPAAGWLDLSTGVNPHAYPLAPFPASALTRLPERAEVDGLIAIARGSYGWADDLPVAAGAGTQAIIQILPYLRTRGSVAVVGPTYGEHAHGWARAGHQVRDAASLKEAAGADVVVVVNPDNPTGRISDPDALEALGRELTGRGGLLVVDEAFADVEPDAALKGRLGRSGVVVLRSFGKFFGLAGLRLGFAAGDEALIRELEAELGPWPVSGPALAAGQAALADDGWIATMRLRLSIAAMRLDHVLREARLRIDGGTDLFRAVRVSDAARLHANLAREGVWVRRFEDRPDRLRIGLPGDDAAFERLAAALAKAV
jgi:cobalamin biosynthetic protein CobC